MTMDAVGFPIDLASIALVLGFGGGALLVLWFGVSLGFSLLLKRFGWKFGAMSSVGGGGSGGQGPGVPGGGTGGTGSGGSGGGGK